MCSQYTELKRQQQLEKYFRSRRMPLPYNANMWRR